jgi:hypothetical protein
MGMLVPYSSEYLTYVVVSAVTILVLPTFTSLMLKELTSGASGRNHTDNRSSIEVVPSFNIILI